MDEKNFFFWSLKSSSHFFVITEWCKRCCPSYTKKWMDQFCNCRLWHAFWHVITIHCIFFICIYTWFCDFIEPKYRSWSCDNTRTVIYILAKKKVLIWLQVRILDFYHKLFPWAWMIPLPHPSLLLHTCLLWCLFMMII